MDEKLSSLQYRYSESIDRALAKNDHAAAARLGSSYDAKTRRLEALRDADLTPLRRVVLTTLAKIA
jgi:hypothetical protein